MLRLAEISVAAEGGFRTESLLSHFSC
jgi:hypothetical protein